MGDKLDFDRLKLLKRLNRVWSWRGISFYLHWSTILILSIFAVLVPFQGLPALLIGLSYFSILLVHEIGHALLAQRFQYQVHRVEIYPIHGVCHYDQPYSEYEDAIISWGGALAQIVLFVPTVLFLELHGNTQYGAVNVVLVMYTFLNAVILVVNLTPAPGLDGAKAWRVFPILIKSLWIARRLRHK